MSRLSRNEIMPECPVKRIRKLNEVVKPLTDQETVTLELVLMTCFPTVWENIQKALNDQYTQGYIDGRNFQAWGKEDESKKCGL